MNRALELRLRKLEAARKPSDGVFFLIWGRDQDEIELGLSNAVAIGTVSTGDTVVRALWTGHSGLPASRWIGRGTLSVEEDEALVEEMQRRLGITDQELASRSGRPDARLVELSDEQLFAGALGERC